MPSIKDIELRDLFGNDQDRSSSPTCKTSAATPRAALICPVGRCESNPQPIVPAKRRVTSASIPENAAPPNSNRQPAQSNDNEARVKAYSLMATSFNEIGGACKVMFDRLR